MDKNNEFDKQSEPTAHDYVAEQRRKRKQKQAQRTLEGL
jgi:hypothetical protein